MSLSNQQASSTSDLYKNGQAYYGHVDSGSGHTTFAHKTATCPAQNLSSKGAGVGVQTMQTDLLKTMFGGDKGPPTPPGIRMRGIYAASTGFSVQFFPESVVLGCGPDAARAYPYTVVADGTKAVIHVERARSPAHSRLQARRLARSRRHRPLSSPRTHRHRPKRRRRLYLRSHGAVLQPGRAHSQRHNSRGRRHGRGGDERLRGKSRRGARQRRRHSLHSGKPSGQRGSHHRLEASRATRRRKSPRRAPIRSAAQ